MFHSIYKARVWTQTGPTIYIFVGEVVDSSKLDTAFEKIEASTKLKPKLLKAEIKALQERYGDDYEEKLGLHLDGDKQIIKKVINDDDSILLLLKKLVVYLDLPHAPEELYLWYQKTMDAQRANLSYVSNLFKRSGKINFNQFKDGVRNYFGVDIGDMGYTVIDKYIAMKILNSKTAQTAQTAQTVTEPMLFKYMSDGFLEYIKYNPKTEGEVNTDTIKTFNMKSLLSMTLKSFRLENRLFDMVTTTEIGKSLRSVYFPLIFPKSKRSTHATLAKFVGEMDSLENEIRNYSHTNGASTKSYITFIHFKANDASFNKVINLSLIFDKYQTDEQAPFMRLKSSSGMFYKFHKKSLVDLPSNDVEKWTQYSVGKGKNASANQVTFKLRFLTRSFCTFSLSDTLAYDVKFNISIDDHAEMKNIEDFLRVINDRILTEIRQIYSGQQIVLPNLPKTLDTVTLISLSTYNVVSLKEKTFKFNNLEHIIESKLYPYFNILPSSDAGILQLQYKKVDNFVDQNNIELYVQMHNGMKREDLIAKMMKHFNMNHEDAEAEYNKHAGTEDLVMDKNKPNLNSKFSKFNHEYDNFIHVKIRLNGVVNTKFVVTGLKEVQTQMNIAELLEVALDMTNLPAKATKANSKLKKEFDDQMFGEPIPSAASSSASSNIDDLDLSDSDGDSDLDQDFADIEREFMDSEPVKDSPDDQKSKSAAKSKPPIKTTQPDITNKQQQGDALTNLLAADKSLFGYTKGPSYATGCGATDDRQPVVVTPDELQNIHEKYPGAISHSVQVGSTKALAGRNAYICPTVWCPKSRIAMSNDQYEKNNKRCPFEDEEPIVLNAKGWGEDMQQNMTKKRYVGFLKYGRHPDGLCLPCCFSKPTDIKNKQNPCIKNGPDQKDATIIPQDHENDGDLVGNEKYIKNFENMLPLEQFRFGLLPKDLNTILGKKSCGNRHDGTGLLENGTSCYLRKGINHGSQSFLSLLFNVLDIPSTFSQVRTPEDIGFFIAEKLKVEQYLALENGKIIRLFINPDFKIDVESNFKEFRTWFLQQQVYYRKFHLMKVRNELRNNMNVTFEKQHFPTAYKSIIREFMIYNSFKHFLLFLEDQTTKKDHRVLLDLVNTEHDLINPGKVHIVIIDVNPDTKKSVILCPFNRSAKNFADINSSFVFVIKNRDYYEPIHKVTMENGKPVSTHELRYETGDKHVQRLISYYVNNCGTPAPTTWCESIALHLESKGYPIFAYVIDFSFRIRGLILQNHLYIPFADKFDLYHILRRKFVYINDVLDFKCTLQKDVIEKIYHILHLHTKNDLYRIKEFIPDQKYVSKLSALILENDTVVPLRLNKESPLRNAFEYDLQIFTGHQKEDERTHFMRIVQEDGNFDIFFQSVQNYINGDDNLREELEFLTHNSNPFPKDFRRKRIFDILAKISQHILINNAECTGTSCIQTCEVDSTTGSWSKCIVGIPDRFMSKMTEKLLLNRYSYNFIKTYSVGPEEILLDQHDINSNRLVELREVLKNPFKILSERLNDLTDAVVFTDGVDLKFMSRTYLIEGTRYSDVPVKWLKLLPGFKLITNERYNPKYLYTLFLNINESLSSQRRVSDDMFKSIIKTRIISDHSKNDKIDRFFENPSFVYVYENKLETKRKYVPLRSPKPSVEDCLSVIDSPYYYPSFYDIGVLSDIVGVDVVILQRKSVRTPDALEIMNNHGPYSIVLNMANDADKDRHIYSLCAKREKSILLKKRDFEPAFWKILTDKKVQFEVEVEVEVDV
jgi:hypothetical protein